LKYLEFGREIKLLGDNLALLERVLKNAQDQAQAERGQRPGGDLGSALSQLEEVTGDFRETLNMCRKLLEDNSRFRRNQAGFVGNVMWWIGTEKEVENLRGRVHLHSVKVRTYP
jgi:hypothetical protein